MRMRSIVSCMALVAVSALTLQVWADCGGCGSGEGAPAAAAGGCCAQAQQAAAGCPAAGAAAGCAVAKEAGAGCPAATAAAQHACGGCRQVGGLAALAEKSAGGIEWVKLSRGIGIVATVGNGCPQATRTLQRAAAQFPPASVEGVLCARCEQGASLLQGGSAVIDHVNFRSGAMILITSADAATVAQLHAMVAAPVETAMLE